MTPENNDCKGQHINDCPYPDCKCALEYLREMDEDYTEQTLNTAYSWTYIIIGIAIMLVALGILIGYLTCNKL